MKRFLGFVAALAGVLALVNCDAWRTPTDPTRVTTAQTKLALTVSPPGDAPVVPWRCVAVTPFPSADCASNAARTLRALAIDAGVSAPGNPTDLTASVTGGTVRLAWRGPSGGDTPSSYLVEAGSANGLADLASFDTGSTVVALTVEGVPAGAYFVRVRARNAVGVSGSSNEIVVTVTVGASPCGTAPGPPTSLAVHVTGLSVELTWAAPGTACAPTSYVLEAGSASGLSNLANFNTGNTATSFSAHGVGPGTFVVRVRAVNANGASAPSNEISFTTGAPPVPAPGPGPGPCSQPSAPSNFTASVSGATVTFIWGVAVGAPTSYVVEVGTAPGASNIAVTDTGNTSTSLAANVPAGTYFARVRAKNACGTSAASSEVSFTIEPAPCPLPSAPTGLTASVSGTTLTLSWSGTGTPTSYVVEIGTSPGLSNVAAGDTGSTATSLTTTLTPGTYYVRVRARNACGPSNPSNEVTVTVVTVQTTTITITSGGVSPKNLTIGAGTRVTFVNNDKIVHEMFSDPHPEHSDCTEINQVGFLSPGQSRQTGNLNTVQTCGYHDHGNPSNSSLQGTITIH